VVKGIKRLNGDNDLSRNQSKITSRHGSLERVASDYRGEEKKADRVERRGKRGKMSSLGLYNLVGLLRKHKKWSKEIRVFWGGAFGRPGIVLRKTSTTSIVPALLPGRDLTIKKLLFKKGGKKTP